MMAAQRGDEAAYERLLRELAVVIRAFVLSRFGAFSALEDTVQECLIAIHNGRHTYDGARPIRPWLFAIVRNRIVDVLRQRRAYTTAIDDYEGVLRATPSDPIDIINQGQILAKLDRPYRQAFALTKLFGLSVAESATRLGVSESVIKVRVFRAVRMMRRHLQAET